MQLFKPTFSFLLILFGFYFLGAPMSLSQNITAQIGASNSSNCQPGDTISIPVSITTASGIGVSAISLAIEYDTTKLECLNYVTGLNQALSSAFISNCGSFNNLGASYTQSGRQFRVSWFQLNPVQLNGLAFNMNFRVLSPGNSSLTWDLQTPEVCGFYNDLAEEINQVTYQSGGVQCQYNPFSLQTQLVNLGTCSTLVGDTLDVPVILQNYSGVGITSISMAVDYDSTKLRCLPNVIGLQSTLNQNFISNSAWFNNLGPQANTAGSQFRAAWYQLNPVTLSDTLFKIRFVVKEPGTHAINFDLQTPGNCEYSDLNASVIPNTHWVNGSATASSLPQNLFQTDTLFLCGQSTTLMTPSGLGSYTWNTGDTTPHCFVNRTGWYSCTIYAGACTLSDSVYVDLMGLQLISSADTLCAGSVLRLSASLGVPNLSGVFDGNRVYQALNPGPLGSQPRTFGLRFKTNQNQRQSFLSYGTLATGPGLIDLGMNLNVGYGAASGHCAAINSGPSFFSTAHANTWGQSILMNDWNTLTYVMGSGSNMAFSETRVFLNGSLISHGPIAVPSCGHNWGGWTYQTETSPLYLGSGLGANPPFGGTALFSGDFDYISIWDRALSDQEVLEIQNSDPRFIQNGLKHLYTFSGMGPQSELIDEVSHNNAFLVRGSAPNPQSNVRFLWSTGDTTASIHVNPTQTTTYTLQVTDSYRTCYDSFTVVVTTNPLPTSLFALDTLLICGDSINLFVANGYDSYQWSSGDSVSGITARRGGWYACKISLGNCEFIDSVFVSMISDRIDQPTSPVCSGTPVTLRMIGNYSPSLRQGMVAHWAFNGEGNSGYGLGRVNDYEQIGYTADRFGHSGRAASFNGSNQYIQTNQPVLTSYGPYTVSFWAQTTSGSDMEIFSQSCPSDCNINGQFYHDLRVQLNAGQCQTNGLSFKNESHFATANTVTNDGLWHHYTMVLGRNANHSYSNIEFYKDGQFMFVNCGHNWGGWQYMLPQVPTRIGAPLKGGTVPYVGKLDELVVWNRALSQAEINDVLSEQPVRYLWSTGDTTPSITVNPLHTTTYYVTITNGIHSCIDSATIQIAPNTVPVNFLVNDSIFVCGDSALLDAGLGFSRYQWSSGDSTNAIIVRNSGWYRCEISNGLCISEDSVFVSILPNNFLDTDTVVCQGSSLTISTNIQGYILDTTIGGYWPLRSNTFDYSSFNNHAIQNNFSSTLFADGLYFDGIDDHLSISAEKNQNCSFSFWFKTNNSGGERMFFNAGPNGNGPDLFLSCGQLNWNVWDGCNNPLSAIPNNYADGQYHHILLTNHIVDGSKLFYDGILIGTASYRNAGLTNLLYLAGAGNYGDYCWNGYMSDFTLFKKALSPSEVQFIHNRGRVLFTNLSYLWSTGDTTASITVTPSQTTTYYVTVSNGIHNCVDSVTVNVIPNPINPNLFAVDSLFHCGDSVVLDAGTGYTRYEWSAGDTTQTKTVSYTGWHRVRVYEGPCSVEDSVFVSILNIKINDSSLTICNGSSATLQLNFDDEFSYFNTLHRRPQIGDYSFGGIVAHVFDTTDNGFQNGFFKGFVTAENDLPNTYTWGSYNPILFNRLQPGIGYGKRNTDLIISVSDSTGISYPAARSCFNFNHNNFDDWYLPSVDELVKIRSNLAGRGIGNFKISLNPGQDPYWAQFNTGYWSSNMMSNGAGGLAPFFANQGICGCAYFESYWVRPVRDFRIPAYDFLWSTGDTTSSITVSPTQTTTYYVTVSNGIHSCVDSVTVRVSPKIFVPDMAVCQGDTIDVPVIASRLDSVAAISLALNYNQQAMTYVGYTRLRPDMVSTSSIGTAAGQVRLGWFGLSPLVSGGSDTLVYYRFVVNQPGGFSWNTQVQGDCELANLNLDILDYCFEGGQISLLDTVSILSSSQGPWEVQVGDSIQLNVQSTGTLTNQWQRWNDQLGQWENLQDNGVYSGTSTPTLTFHCNTYQRPFPKFRLELTNGCRPSYGPEMPVTILQNIHVSIGQSTSCQGDTLDIPVLISGAREIGAVSLVMNFNTGSVQFLDWMNAAPQTGTNPWFVNQVGNEIRLAWYSLQSANIPDGQPLGVLRVIGMGTTSLNWDLLTPGNCEFGDEEATTIPASFTPGFLSVNPKPVVQLQASASAICPNGGTTTLSTIFDPNYTYQWFLNGQPISSSQTSTLTTGQSGPYQVLVSTSLGCSQLSSVETIVNHPLPNPVITVIGSATTCDQPVTLNVNATQGNSLEFWWHLNGAPLSNSPGTQWIATQSGDYSVYAMDLNTQCIAWSSAVTVTIHSLPTATVSYNGSTSFCLGDSLALVANSGSGFVYQWTRNGQILAGSTYQNYMAYMGGDYAVTVTNGQGCSSTSSPIFLSTQNCNQVTGRLSYNNALNTALRNTKVYFQDSIGLPLDSTITNLAGDFSFSGFINGTYKIKSAPSLTWGGVNATDALGVVRHYTNYVLLQGFRLKAADVNGSNNVNNTDALLITRRYSNLIPQFNVGPWLSENPTVHANGYPIVSNIQALCYGDVNGSYNPIQTRIAPRVNFEEYGTIHPSGKCYKLPIYALENQEIGAISLALVLPKGVVVKDVHSKINHGTMEFGQWEDELRIAWFSPNQFNANAGDVLFVLEVCSDMDSMSWGPTDLEVRGLSELADFWANPYDFSRLGLPSVKSRSVSGDELVVWPNPVQGNTYVRWTFNEPTTLSSIRVMDAVGKEVYSERFGWEGTGAKDLVLPSSEWAEGIYAIQAQWTTASGHTKTKSLLLRRK